jgi:hypothetical protein
MLTMKVNEMKTDELKTRFLGSCQICEAEQKLHGNKLVHHGYKRPGWGSIVGDCYGVHAAPYEVSCDLLVKYLPLVQDQLGNVKNYLSRIQSGQVTYLTEERRVGMVEYVVGVTAFYAFTNAVFNLADKLSYQVRQLEAEVTRIQKRIAVWKLAPVRTIEERAAEEKAAKDVRAAERAAARQVRLDKAAATKAKQEALAAKREAIKQSFTNEFISLAACGNKVAAKALYLEMNKKKYSFFYAQELKLDEVFISLGLATRRNDGWVQYLIP